MLHLYNIRLVDTACVDPEVFQAVLSSSVAAEFELFIYILFRFGSASFQITESDLIAVFSPCMGKNRVWLRITISKVCEANFAIAQELQKARGALTRYPGFHA
jgi:hypothetical protein